VRDALEKVIEERGLLKSGEKSTIDLFADLICPLKSPFWRQLFPCRLAYISRVCLGGEERTATKIINFSVQSRLCKRSNRRRPHSSAGGRTPNEVAKNKDLYTEKLTGTSS